MSNYQPHTRDVDETINAIVAEAAPVAAITAPARLRLIRNATLDANRPAGLVAASDPTMPVMLALGDWAQLLALSADTPMASKLEATPARVDLSVQQFRAVRLMLANEGTEWADNVQEHVCSQIHPSFLPPSADEAPAHGYPRPSLA